MTETVSTESVSTESVSTSSVSPEVRDVEFPIPRRCPFAEPPEYGRMRERAPISRVQLPDGKSAWWVSRWAEAREILADGRFSSDRRRKNFPLINADPESRKNLTDRPPALIGMDGAEHSAARRAVVGEFTVKRIAALRPRIQQIVDGAIDDLIAAAGPQLSTVDSLVPAEGRRPVDLVKVVSLPVPSLVICELLGVPYLDHDFFQSRTTKLLRRTTEPRERQRLFCELTDYIDDLVRRKETEPGDDLFSRQIERRRAEGTLDHESMVSLAALLLIAGHETTANMISLGVLGLLEHPEQLALIKDDPARTPLAVEELLRYFTIVEAVTARVATEDVRIGGVTIEADDGVVISGLSADWDPEVFDHPDELDVVRGARHHIAFGYGPHQCLGQNLARMELEVVFDTLFRRVPGLRLAVPVDEVSLKTDANIYGIYELPVTW